MYLMKTKNLNIGNFSFLYDEVSCKMVRYGRKNRTLIFPGSMLLKHSQGNLVKVLSASLTAF